MVYTSDDPIVARELEAIGCVAIMPLASLIVRNGHPQPWNLRLILRRRAGARRRGVGRYRTQQRDGARLRGVLMNTAIAQAPDPVRWRAMGGRGGWPRRVRRANAAVYAASSSSPTSGLIT
jgi:thiazole synthase